MQRPVEVSVPATVEAMPGSLPATCFEWGSASKGGEGRLAADAPAVGPADQELSSDDRADAGFGEQRRPGRVLLDQGEEFWVQLGGLCEQEPDPGGDRPEHQDRDPVLYGGADGNGERLDEVELLAQRLAAQSGPQVFRRHHDEAFELVDGLGAADQNGLPGGHDLP
jgi:hypothetical protein